MDEKATKDDAIMSKLQKLKEGLSKIKVLELELAGSKWNEDPSPKSVSDFHNSLLERYQKAKSLYMKRRLETFMVDNVTEFDENTNQFDIPDISSIASDNHTDDDAARTLEEKHAKALAELETAAQGINAKISNMRNAYQMVISRRKELEQMVQDLEQDEDKDDGAENDKDQGVAIDVGDEDAERKKAELLQQKKRELEEEYDRLLKAKEERMKSISQSRNELALLKEEESKIIESGKDPTQFNEKIKELKEMKEFYDSLREVMEELGGVAILDAREDIESHHLFLTVSIYEKHRVEFELEVHRKTLLKLVDAKWLTNPVLSSVRVDDIRQEQFSLPLAPLDDLVQTAKTSMGPPHDLRFVVRETCARIRNIQNRVDDIALLRRRVLTKVVGNDQVVCSLNEGIVIVMRLYDQWVKVEQIVGVSGWNDSTTKKIQEVVSKRDETWTPNLVVELVQKEVERLKAQDGLVLPKTPVLPLRRKRSADEK
mmetsp:Transcript_26974/g.74162  ORF Transcript_26974/g.74162 Transcript_26974/m.74162 type:complete len:486 (+) Transcript_26974:61-1518(+)